MDLICYLHPAWSPLIRPAPATRAWMDATQEAFAYRCLPLNIANAHGWEILSPCGFEASWTGGSAPEDVIIRLDPGADPTHRPVALFGNGVLTFHVEGIFRTPKDWSLWVSGSPNQAKHGVAPLTGVIETDWSPYTFTMNWRFTRAGQAVRFEAGEPFCFLFPIQRGALESFEPRLVPLAHDPELEQRFMDWSRSRDAFHQKMRSATGVTPADKWQKFYYRGEDSSGARISSRHQIKLRLKSFDAGSTPGPQAEAVARAADYPAAPDRPSLFPETPSDPHAREWLLEAMERQCQLSPAAAGIPRLDRIDTEGFLERFYAPCRPVVLTDSMAGWPALTRWTPDYLRRAMGAAPPEARSGRDLDAGALAADIGSLDGILDSEGDAPHGRMWVAAAGAWTPLHPELRNTLIAQVVGRKRVILVPPAYAGRLYPYLHLFAEAPDLEHLDAERFPLLKGVHAYVVELEPGEMLFAPLGWWRQEQALDFNASVTFANFRWPNPAPPASAV
jgi:hypothetical protein